MDEKKILTTESGIENQGLADGFQTARHGPAALATPRWRSPIAAGPCRAEVRDGVRQGASSLTPLLSQPIVTQGKPPDHARPDPRHLANTPTGSPSSIVHSF
jgi:hypothetical protein